jgi:dolichyl-diphosphooligosaccharide---protein glycosyltransferase
LNSHTKLFQAGSFNVKLNHLVIIGVLVLAFSISFLIRSQPIDYGFELNEFDPFFNFRATEYIVEHGLTEYFEWNDDKSWYPNGRDVSATSQVMLHITAAITYQIFGGNSSLYDYAVLFPILIGSLTVVVIFGLVRLFAGTSAGLFASLLFAVSLPIILRGSAGWFKSEPLGIFYGLFGLYLFLSAIKSENKKIAILKIISGAIIMGFGMASWGGNQFFIIPLGLFIFALPFVRKDHKFLLWSIPLFVILFLLISSMFERPGPNFVFSMGGLSLIIPTIFLFLCIFIQKVSKDKNKIRNGLSLLISIVLISSFFVIVNPDNIIGGASFRYLNAINPFLTSVDPLVDSVAEHATTSIKLSFFLHSILLIFSGIGVWFLLSKKISQSIIFERNDMRVFVLIIGITGVYVSSTFIRLEVFASISLIILSSISLSILSKAIFQINISKIKSYILKISFVMILLALFVMPLIFPTDYNWISVNDTPPVILTGGTAHPASSDWLESLEWIKTNTPENSVILSWWDYGYWIQTLSERASIADNSTTHTSIIQNIARVFLSSPDNSWNTLQEMNVDYVLVFVAGERIDGTYDGKQLYHLADGGDESKIPWFVRISELPIEQFLYYNLPNDYFWNETLLGKLIPFNVVSYYHPELQRDYNIYEPGTLPLSIEEIKYTDSKNDPLWLVYASPSFHDKQSGPMTGVFIYEINKNYVLINNTTP